MVKFQFPKTIQAIRDYLKTDSALRQNIGAIVARRRMITMAFAQEFNPQVHHHNSLVEILDETGELICSVSHAFSNANCCDIILHARQHCIYVGTISLETQEFTPRL
jgi:hypothetical protein